MHYAGCWAIAMAKIQFLSFIASIKMAEIDIYKIHVVIEGMRTKSSFPKQINL